MDKAFESKEQIEGYMNALAAPRVVWPRQGLVAKKKGVRDGFGLSIKTLINDLSRFFQLLSTKLRSMG